MSNGRVNLIVEQNARETFGRGSIEASWLRLIFTCTVLLILSGQMIETQRGRLF
ncbi:hypothetical protein BR93DRAFT_925201 [Coniochaeta sp. PMI_546]|nr:hypothetical protein BR93DRAFT_925201 [Coniochaeta sp. PMI_546]